VAALHLRRYLRARPWRPGNIVRSRPILDTEVEYQGLTILRPTAQTYTNGRSVTFRDITAAGTGGPIPTQNMLWQVINSTMPNVDMEVDKLVSSMVVTGTTMKNMNFQSSSVDLLTMDNSTITGNLLGTPKKAVISDSKINEFYPGAYAYGRSDELQCTTCIIGSINLGGNLYAGPTGNGIDTNFTMNNGVITIPNSYGAFAANWAVPGTNVVWQDSDRVSISMFQVVDVTQDATNTYVRTNQTGGFPRTITLTTVDFLFGHIQRRKSHSGNLPPVRLPAQMTGQVPIIYHKLRPALHSTPIRSVHTMARSLTAPEPLCGETLLV